MAADLNAGLMFFGDVLLRVRIAASTVEDGAAGEVVEGIHGSQTAVSEHLAAFVQPEHAPGFRRLQEEAIAEAARGKGEERAGLGLALKVREKAGRHQARGVARLPLLLGTGATSAERPPRHPAAERSVKRAARKLGSYSTTWGTPTPAEP